MTATTMPIVGYGDRWSVQPGETLRFMVSAEAPRYQARVVRLIHGDTNPAGPASRSARSPRRSRVTTRGASRTTTPDRSPLCPTPTRCNRVTVSPSPPGSSPPRPASAPRRSWPNGTKRPEQATPWSSMQNGALALWLGDGEGGFAAVSTGQPLRPFTWYQVETSFDLATGWARLRQRSRGPVHIPSMETETEASFAVKPAATRAPLTIGAWSAGAAGERVLGSGFLNGKIDCARNPPRRPNHRKLGFRARFRL